MREVGYTKIENYFLHGLARAKIKSTVLQTVLAIFRATIGYHLTERVLSYEQITRWTGFDRRGQIRYVQGALKKNLISRYQLNTNKFVYEVNLDPLTWKVPLRLPERHFNEKKRVVVNQPPERGSYNHQKLVVIQPPAFLKDLLKG